MIKKDLTERMIEVLRECHERELMGIEPYTVLEWKFRGPLLKNGYVETKLYKNKNGKTVLAFLLPMPVRSI